MGLFSGKRPADLGVRDGRLKAVPATPNAVSSQAQDSQHAVAPIAYRGTRADALSALVRVMTGLPGARIISQTDDYLYAECETPLLGFVDDLEFYLPAAERIIHVRSASRLGHHDLGTNRRRVEDIRARLAARGL